jgi:hypothetical protein
MSIEDTFGSFKHGRIEVGLQAVTSNAADLLECFLDSKLTVIGSFEAIATELVTSKVMKVKAMFDNLIYISDL